MTSTLLSLFSPTPEPTLYEQALSHITPHVQSLTSLIQPQYTQHVAPHVSALNAHVNHALLSLPVHWQTRFGAFSTKQMTHALAAIPAQQWQIVLSGISIGILLTLVMLYMISLKHTSKHVLTYTVFWFTLCTIVHSWLELHFVFFRSTSSIAQAMDLYSAGDFRYGRPLEAGTAAMEGITALIVGPLSLLTAIAIVRDWSIRHVLQLTVSTCQMYGLTWFMAQPVFAAVESLTTDPLLFWVVAFALNAPWYVYKAQPT
jgi:hypothetical protein